MKKKAAFLLVGVLLLAVLLGAFLVSGRKENDGIVIGGKNFTEQDILVYLMQYLIEEKTGLTVKTKPFLGGTSVVAQALERGDIDLYAEYTGTALINLLRQPQITDPQETYEKVKATYKEQKHLIWLEPWGFNNTYTLTMRADQAEKLGIETFSDLVMYAPGMVLGATQEFLERPDGYKGLQADYGLKFERTSGLDAGLTYAACRDREVDVIDAFATDGRIAAFNLKVLRDDKQFFPPYYAAPVVREDVLEKHPEIATALNLLAGRLNDREMARLNAQVDLEKKDAKSVAMAWLKAQGLVK